MENLSYKEIRHEIYDIVIGLQTSRSLLTDGKQILCARKLQGIEYKTRILLSKINEVLKDEDETERSSDVEESLNQNENQESHVSL